MNQVTGSTFQVNFTHTHEKIQEPKSRQDSKIVNLLNQSLSSLRGLSKSIKSNPVKWSGVALGTAIGCYGVYHFVLGMQNSKPEDAVHMANADHFLNYEGNESCEARLEAAKKTFLSCPTAQKLWNEVEKEGRFTVKCPENHAEEPPTGASVVVKTRTITVSGKNKHMTSPFLFELSNLKRAKMLSGIQNGKCSLPRDLYAISIEAVEHETVKETYDISSTCAKEGYWPKELVRYERFFNEPTSENDWSDFPKFLEFQEKTAHPDLYRRSWYQQCDPSGLNEWYETNRPKWQAIAQAK